MHTIGWDTETRLIAPPDQIIPTLVCSTAAAVDLVDGKPTVVNRAIYVRADERSLTEHLLRMWRGTRDQRSRIIVHNAAFDITVAMRYALEVGSKDLYYLMWEVMETNLDLEWSRHMGEGQQLSAAQRRQPIDVPMILHDTGIREKLRALSRHGDILLSPGGTKRNYALWALVKKWLGVDISDNKVTMRDGRYFDGQGNDITGTAKAGAAWRLRYAELEQVPLEQWPSEAVDYAVEDAELAAAVWWMQEQARAPMGHGSMNSESLQIYADVCLRITTANGFEVDRDQVERLRQHVDRELAVIEPDLRAHGILRSNGSINTSVVKQTVEALWDRLGREPVLTDSGDIATGKEVMEILSEYDPTLICYSERQKLAKLRDAFLPSLRGARAYTNFDILKETGRTSSYGEREGKHQANEGSFNSQQMPRRPGVRECLVPRRGYLFTSVDYKALELCSVGEVTYFLFGHSVHRELINQGMDLHSYLGASLAIHTDPGLVGSTSDRMAAYKHLITNLTLKVDDQDNSSTAQDMRHIKKQAKKYRNLAKPIGLGYPGGLGVKTMPVFARTVYHVDITEEQSREFKAMWLDTYPEMVQYFKWLQTETDPNNKGLYVYHTPGLQRFRAACTYCAASNGMAMQSLSADGAKRSIAWLGRATAGGLAHDSDVSVILDQCYTAAFIHDEHFIAIPDDDLATERALAISRLMRLSMLQHMPDMRIDADPALMRRWVKDAEPWWVDDQQGWERAIDLCARQYGQVMANMVVGDLRAPGGTHKRLAPWDDFNSWEAFGLEDAAV